MNSRATNITRPLLNLLVRIDLCIRIERTILTSILSFQQGTPRESSPASTATPSVDPFAVTIDIPPTSEDPFITSNSNPTTTATVNVDVFLHRDEDRWSLQTPESNSTERHDYSPVRPYWFYSKKIQHRVTWIPFSVIDARRLDEAYAQSTSDDQFKEQIFEAIFFFRSRSASNQWKSLRCQSIQTNSNTDLLGGWTEWSLPFEMVLFNRTW